MLSVKQCSLQNSGYGVRRPVVVGSSPDFISTKCQVLSGSQFLLICYMKELGSVSVPVLPQ